MLRAERVGEALQVGPPEIVVLVEDRDLRLRLGLQRVTGVDRRLAGVELEERQRPGIMLGVDDPEARKKLGTLFSLR